MEEFFKNHANTFQALSAIATAATVMLTLWLARRESEKLEVKLGVYVTVVGGAQYDDVINMNTKNIGLKTAYIPAFCFWFKIPFRKSVYTINPERNETIELIPGRSQLIKLTTVPSFHSEFKRVFERDVKNLRWLRLRFIKGYMSTESGSVYKISFDSSFKKQLSKLLESLE
ncbi:MAG: hypothetical protein V4735_06980 [Pseudomonadota bacterium]